MAVKFTKPEINVREKLAELDKPSGIAGKAMLRAETPQEQFNLIGAGRRNLIINGDMRVAQRGTSETGLITSTRAGPDRFRLDLTTNQSGTHTLSQATDAPSNFKYSWKVECTTAQASPNQMRCSYPIEGYDVAHLGYGTTEATPLTLSFWVKSNVVGTYALSIETAVAYRYFSANYTIDFPNVWEYKTIYIPGDQTSGLNGNNTLGLYLSWWLTSNSSLKVSPVADNWVTQSSYNNIVGTDTNVNMASSTANSWQITGVQLETGKVATPFEHRSYGEELALCQRYYQVLANISSDSLGACSRWNSSNVFLFADLPVEMRSVPTLDTNISTNTSALATKMAGNTSTHNNLTIDGDSSPRKIRLNTNVVPSGSSDGQAGWIRVNQGSIYVNLSAEL